nr:hypothetical protein [Tanacetum cinerariifolium]
MVITNWKLRPKGLKRTRAHRRVYKGGNVDWFDDVNANGFFVIEVSIMRKELDMFSYVHKFKLMEVFIEHPVDTYVIDTDHEEDSDDLRNGTHENEDIWSVNANVDEFDHVFSYLDINHDNVDDVNVGLGNDIVDEFDLLFSYPDTNHDNVDDVNSSEPRTSPPNKTIDVRVKIEGINSEDSDGSEDSKDNDFECDIEDQINDVHVDMKMFRKHTDPSVEWVGRTEPEPEVENNEQFEYEECDLGDFDSEINSDKDEARRKKALNKLTKCHKHVNVEKRRQLYLTRNDKERVRAECKGVVLVFSNSGPSGAGRSNNVGLSDGPSRSQTNIDKPTGLDSKMKREKGWEANG